jgi:hypothetical protein
MRVLVLVLSALALSAGCAGDDASEGALDETLRYFPADITLLAVVSTDLESDQVERLDPFVRRRFGHDVEGFLRDSIEGGNVSWERDVKPLLGGELVYGTHDAPFVEDRATEGLLVVFRSSDGEDAKALLEKFGAEPAGESHGADVLRADAGDWRFAIDGDTVLFAENEATLDRALERSEGSNRLTAERFEEVLAGLPEEAIARGYGDPSGVLAAPELARLRELPWVAAVRTAGVAVSFRDDRVVVDFALNTDPDRIDAGDLPLATGAEPPEVLRRDGQILGGNRNQSLTTAFLFRLAELRFPDSRFVLDVHQLERELGIDFVAEVLRQFNGPSASAVSPDGETFAARSKVRDPEALRQLLPRLAPHLPRLVEGLEALRSEGQALLFLFAPDVLALQSPRVSVERVGELWRVSGLTGEGPDQLFFGVLGDVFVVASDAAAARRVADEETEPVEGAQGAGVLRADLAGRERQLEQLLPFGVGPTGEIVAWLRASEEGLRGRVTAELP